MPEPTTAERIYEHMASRRSVRRFKPEVPPRELLQRLIEGAVTAPSASNKQPWRFLIVSDRERIDAMAAAVRQATARIAEHIEPDARPSFERYGDYFTRFEDAPVVIVPLCRSLTLLSNLTGESLPDGDRQRVEALERDSGLIGTSMALQNLLLAAHALGLGASGMTGPLVAVDTLRELLGVRASWHVVALVPVGFPDEEPVPTARKPVNAVIRWLT